MTAAWVEKFKARLWYAANHHLQRQATAEYRKAVREGCLLPLPCVVCGVSPTHGHHEDYARPLDVVWLCPIHHSWRHRYGLTVEAMRSDLSEAIS